MLVTMHIKKLKIREYGVHKLSRDFYPSICLCLILIEYEEKGKKCQQIEFSFTIFHSFVVSEIHK